MANYTTESNLEDFLNIDITSGEADTAMEQATELIDNITKRTFETGTATVRWFKGNGRKLLRIDDATEVTKVEKGNDKWGDSLSTVDSDDYILQPRNYSERGIPIKGIYLKSGYWGFTEDGAENHKITAKWGYSDTPPDDIVLATTIIASGIYSQNRSSGHVEREKIGNYWVTYGSDKGWNGLERSKSILDNYTRLEI